MIKIQFLPPEAASPLFLGYNFRKEIVYSENHKKPINTVCG
jgi:hypothetical protein